MSRIFYLEVLGVPAAKGSVSAFSVKRKSGKMGTVVVHSSKSKTWETIIREAITSSPKLLGPVSVELWLWTPRPKTVKRAYPEVTPDIDKLARAVLDAIKEIWIDDSQAVDLEVHERYATEEFPPGVFIFAQEREDDREIEAKIIQAIRQQRLAYRSGV